MSFLELAKKRYSVRSYKPDPVGEQQLQEVLEAARLAPTAANYQAFQLIVIHTKGREGELGRIYGRPFFVQAPLLVCVCGLRSKAWVRKDGKNYCDVDAAIVMDHITLAAADLGLGTCWIGAFDAAAARSILGLPDDAEPIAFTTLGHPDGQPPLKKRKEMFELIRYERW